jgi:protein disulfide-isomerase
MKTYLVFFLCLFAALTGTSCFAHPAQSGNQINWQTDYRQALSQAQASSKPLLLLFTGSDWCSYCIKLEHDILQTPEFVNTIGDQFVFVKLDFPRRFQLPENIQKQNASLQERFGISGYPTIILVDPATERQIGKAGYQAEDGKAYAQRLLQQRR